MTIAITSSSASAAALQADIARYRKTRAECENCESSKTPEGRRNIDELSRKISDAESSARTATAEHRPVVPTVRKAGVVDAVNAPSATSVIAPLSQGTLGSRIDLFA